MAGLCTYANGFRVSLTETDTKERRVCAAKLSWIFFKFLNPSKRDNFCILPLKSLAVLTSLTLIRCKKN